MRTSSRREKRPYHHGDLRNALLDAGLAILADDGIGAVTLRAVAARAGVSHAAPAHHFGNLKGLMTALAAIAFRRLYASIQAARGAAPKELIEQARASCRGYVHFAEANPGLFRLMFTSSLLDHDDPDLEQAGKAAFDQLLELAAKVAAARGDSDVQAVALQIWCMVHGFAHLSLEGQIDAPADRLPDIANLLLGGIRASGSAKAKPKRR